MASDLPNFDKLQDTIPLDSMASIFPNGFYYHGGSTESCKKDVEICDMTELVGVALCSAGSPGACALGKAEIIRYGGRNSFMCLALDWLIGAFWLWQADAAALAGAAGVRDEVAMQGCVRIPHLLDAGVRQVSQCFAHPYTLLTTAHCTQAVTWAG
jgi:hypothetical protein